MEAPITEPTQTPRVTPSTSENTPPQPTKPTLSEKKGGKLDPAVLYKSLQKPTSEWGKEEVPPTQPKKQESVAPFVPGSFPGVDKWQPGKGAINNQEAMKIREKVKEPA